MTIFQILHCLVAMASNPSKTGQCCELSEPLTSRMLNVVNSLNFYTCRKLKESLQNKNKKTKQKTV